MHRIVDIIKTWEARVCQCDVDATCTLHEVTGPHTDPRTNIADLYRRILATEAA